MKIISVSTDRKVFEKGSAVRARLLDYGRLAEEIHVIVFAKRASGFLDEKIAPNVYLYSTNSFSKFTHICAAIYQARTLKRKGTIIDLVTTQDPFETGMAGFRIARLFGARLHIQIHTDFLSKYFAQESFLNRVRVVTAKFIIGRADSIRVVSERIKNSLSTFNFQPSTITVLPIFVEKSQDIEISPEKNLKIKYPQFNFRALVVARLAPEKNIASAIEAMVLVVKTNLKTGLIIVGDGPEKSSLEKLVKHLNLKNNVIFEGWQENLSSYYKTADVFVMPSLYEGYGMAAVEATMAGCPVVMTDVGCAGDVVRDGQNGLIVPVGDTKALALALERIMSGELKFSLESSQLLIKEEYLVAYQKSWQDALL